MALALKGIHKSFGPTIALDGVDLELREGEVHALIGENGAGKSTLMNIIAGSLQPDRGTMEIQGQPYAPSNPLDARTHGIALIHQELSLMPAPQRRGKRSHGHRIITLRLVGPRQAHLQNK